MTQVDVKSRLELESLSEQESFLQDYIVIRKSNSLKKHQSKQGGNSASKPGPMDPCCSRKGTDECICDFLVYQVRPYTYEILRAIQPFFEIVVFSKMHHQVLENIIDHIEAVLNRPIRECR